MENVKFETSKKNFFEKPRIYLDQLLTVDELSNFKRQLLFEIKTLLKEHGGLPTKKWLKSREVRKLLGISPGTLQAMRTKGILPYKRVGGLIYHDSEEIQKMMESKKQEPNFR
jgi:hypothetical protein